MEARTKTCPYCQTEFAAEGRQADARRFCSSKCRLAWNNRRGLRGAVLYDFFMTNRYERGLGAKLKLMVKMCRLAAQWYEEDRQQRTWSDPREFISENPWLNYEHKSRTK